MCEIERTLRRGANMPHIKYNKDKVEGYKLEIQVILGTLNAPSSPLDENLNVGERAAARLASVNPHDTVTASVFESGTSLAPHSLILYGILTVP
jgi:hypothetical protein